MKKFSYLTFLIIAIFSFQVFAQGGKGKVSGKLIDKANGEDLIGAVVQVEGQNIGTATDIEGQFLLSLDPGFYTLILNYVSYKTEKIQGVEVKAGQVTYLNFAMQEESTQLEEVVITYTVDKASTDALLIERKNSAQVSDGVSADLIRKTPDRSTADILKRVTGASIQEGKFAIIRGMSDRYNAGYLNGAPLPSTESDRKAFSFDVIPATLVDKLVIIKAGSPELTGDFGGGVIQIHTKSIPDKLTQSISIGGQYHSLTTFKDFNTFKGSSTDIFGIDDGKRDSPVINADMSANSSISKDERVVNSKLFNDDWSIRNRKPLLNGRFSYTIGVPMKVFKKDLGIIASYNYSNSMRTTDVNVKNYTTDANFLIANYEDKRHTQNISNGGIVNISLKLTPTNLISLRNLYNINTDFSTTLRKINTPSSDFYGKQFADIMTYNRIFSTQLSGEHSVGKNWFKITWLLNNGDIIRTIPDYKIALYSGSNPNRAPSMGFGDQFTNSTGRFFSNLSEKINSASLDVAVPFKVLSIKNEFKAGFYVQRRSRDFTSRNFTYLINNFNFEKTKSPDVDLTENNISAANTGLVLIERTNTFSDNYKANSSLNSFYGLLDQKPLDWLRLVYGIRYESFSQGVRSKDLGNEVNVVEAKVVNDVLPSLNSTISLNDKTNLRLAIYKTLNRPEFRELSPFGFYNFDMNSDIRGNVNLKRSSINNIESRFEYYPSANQILSIGGFYKIVQNPIELRYDLNVQAVRTVVYNNEKSAKIYGIEMEFRKSFEFIGKVFAPKIFNSLTAYSNLALIKSEIQLNEGSTSSKNRPLQGQSPYVVNMGLQYENIDNGWSSSLVLNRVGRRIVFVGGVFDDGGNAVPFGFDIWENPRTVIDFQLSKKINKLNLKATMGDILRQDLVLYNDVNTNYKLDDADNKLFKTKMGYTVTLSASLNF